MCLQRGRSRWFVVACTVFPIMPRRYRSVLMNRWFPLHRLRLYDVRYQVGGGVFDVPEFHFDSIESWLRRAYPIADLIVERKQHLSLIHI